MKVLKEPEIDQWKAVPRRYPPPSPTPNRMANGIAMRLPMIGPTAMHAIRLSVPSSRNPMLGPPGLAGTPCGGAMMAGDADLEKHVRSIRDIHRLRGERSLKIAADDCQEFCVVRNMLNTYMVIRIDRRRNRRRMLANEAHEV